ncbi:hypothetical protein OSTOST_19928, partial [Ostertagia ostertagi]
MYTYLVTVKVSYSDLHVTSTNVVDFFVILDAVIDAMVEPMWFAPLGITCLVCGNLLELDDLSDTASVLLLYAYGNRRLFYSTHSLNYVSEFCI